MYTFNIYSIWVLILKFVVNYILGFLLLFIVGKKEIFFFFRLSKFSDLSERWERRVVVFLLI